MRHAMAQGARLLGLAVLLSACDPALRGECRSQTDCPSGTSCEEGLCIGPGAAGGDGGIPASADAGVPPACDPACGADYHCVATQCTQDFAPEVTLVAPAAQTVIGGTPLPAAATARAPGGVTGVEFRLGTLAKGAGTRRADGAWQGTVDLSSQRVASGTYQLVAHMLWNGGNSFVDSAPVSVLVDKTGPVITLQPVAYPARPDGHPAKNAFLRTDTVVVDASIVDVPGGLGTSVPTLSADGVGPVAGVAQGAGVFRFTFDGRLPPFARAAGDLGFTLWASDRFGNASSLSGTVRMSRLRWQWSKPRGNPLGTAPAIIGGNVVVGSDDHFVYGIRRTDGATAWEEDVGSPVVGHIAAGDSLVYAATSEGRVYGLRPEEQLPGPLPRRVFRCPDLPAVDGELRQLNTGVSVARTAVSGTDIREVDTLFALSADGQLRMFRREAFPVNGQASFGCTRDLDLGTTNDAAVPAMLRDVSGELAAYVGDRDGDFHKVRVTRSTNGVLALNEAWKYTVPRAKILAPAAIGAFPNGGLGVVLALDSGGVRALDLLRNTLWTVGNSTPLSNPIRASPVISDGGVGLVDQRGKAQRVSLGDGRSQLWQHDFPGQTRGVSAAAAPVMAADGRTYLAAGGQLNVVGADGTLEWAYDTRPTAAGVTTVFTDAGTPALACDGTLYVPLSDTSTGSVLAIITDSPGLARDSWPKGFHDNRNSSNYRAPVAGGACAD